MTYDINKAFLQANAEKFNAKGAVFTSPNGTRWSVADVRNDEISGYQGALVKNLDTGKYEMVSRGTEPGRELLKDGTADLQMALGKLPDQVESARDFLQKSKEFIQEKGGNPNTDLSLVGPSLGGSITMVLGAENPQLQATAFNPYGVGNLVPPGEYPNVTSHVMSKDFVSVLPGSKMIGTTYMYEEPVGVDTVTGSEIPTGAPSHTLASHFASNFLDSSVSSQAGVVVKIDVPRVGADADGLGALSNTDPLGNYQPGNGTTTDSSTEVEIPEIIITAPRETHTNTFSHYLDTQGNALSSAQQTALATQLDKLGLGGEGALSFYSLPSGGALIANADGDIVGEINQSANGSLNLKATSIDSDGNTVEVNQHITEQGTVQTQDQYNAQAQQQANASVNLFNSLMATQQWAQLDDMGKLAVLVNVYSAVDTLGGELPGDLGGLASVLSLMQGLESGNDMLVLRSSLQLGQMGLDAYSDYMADLAMQMADDLMASATVDAASSAAMDAAAEAALESAAASNAAGQAVPYVSYVMALQNFEDHPEQAIGTMAGTYVGTAIGACFGPVGAAIGGAIGGMIGGMVGGMFGGDDDIPMREGLAHAQWDESGHTLVVTTQDAEGGGSNANSWMSSLVNGLQAHLDQVVDANGHAQFALIPNLLPSVGFKYDPDGFNLANGARGFMYLQWTDEAGQTQTRYYDGAGNRGDGSGETLSGDFVQHAQGAIAPAWQVQTVLAHYQQSGEIDLPKQTHNLPTELADGLHQTLQVVSLQAANDDCMRSAA